MMETIAIFGAGLRHRLLLAQPCLAVDQAPPHSLAGRRSGDMVMGELLTAVLAIIVVGALLIGLYLWWLRYNASKGGHG